MTDYETTINSREKFTLISVKQTPFIVRKDDGLTQELEVSAVSGDERDAFLGMDGNEIWRGTLQEGECTFPVRIPLLHEARIAVFTLLAEGAVSRLEIELNVPKRWQVHVVQLSHHDPGYTDVPSHVMEESTRWLDEALTQLDERADYPCEARPRIVVEQAWSLKRFLDCAVPDRREKMLEYIRRGDIEVTALYANLISEILGHEECLRALYPSRNIAEETGVELYSAEHNDIPGFTWGICEALCAAGVRFFCPGLPLYYSWGAEGMSSFWDSEAVFGHRGPGAFWWEAQSGKRLLFWCNNTGCGGGADGRLRDLAGVLQKLEEENWPYDVLRWPVQGANRDNSPYIAAYADTVKEWNERYVSPRLIMSTEKMFCEAFLTNLKRELPVCRGGIDGQDYPVAAMSQAASVTIARETHAVARAAEVLHTLTSDDALLRDQTPKLNGVYLDMLMADEHAFGYHFPASPAQRASYWEHGVYSARANADAHDVLSKAMASIADRTDREGLRLVVFNLSGKGGDKPVDAPLRAMDNSGTEIRPSNADPSILRSYLLNDRMQTHPQGDLLQGKFTLTDGKTGEVVPYELYTLECGSPEELAAERTGLAAGTKRLGFFEEPAGIGKLIRFTAKDMPGFGYRVYALRLTDKICALRSVPAEEQIENEFYTVYFDGGGICSVTDKRDGKELLDPACPHRLGEVLVRNGNEESASNMRVLSVKAQRSEISSSVEIEAEADGFYRLLVRVMLRQGIDRVEVAVRAVKSTKPLQTTFIAFPFAGSGLRYQSVLSEEAPAQNSLAGSHSDILGVSDWVAVSGSGILWNSASSPVASLSHLWKGYISPAHRCVADLSMHPPLKPEQFDTGWIYSVLTCNNFGTNFFVSQTFDGLYRYSFGKGDVSDDNQNALWGCDAAMPVPSILTERRRGSLPPGGTLLDAGGAHVLTYKHAKDGSVVLRLMNHSDSEISAPIHVKGAEPREAWLCDALEKPCEKVCGDTILPPHGVVTLKLIL